MPKKRKIDNRLDKLFREIKPDDAPSKPKRTKVTHGAPLPVTDLRPAAVSSEPVTKPQLPTIQPPPAVRPESEDGGPSSLSVSFQASQQDWATLQIVDETTTRTWSQNEQLLVKQVADQLSLALENAQLFQETKKRAEETAVLNDLGRALASRLTFDQVINEVHNGIKRLLSAQNFYVAFYDREKNEVYFPQTVTESELDRSITRIPMGEGLTSYMIKTGNSVLINDGTDKWMEARGLVPTGELAKSFMGVPMLHGKEVIGAIALQDYSTYNVYSQHDLELLQAFSNQASIAFQNANLFQETQQRADELAALNRIVSSSGQTLELNQLLDVLLHQILDVLGFSSGLISLYDESRQGLVLVTHHNLPAPVLKNLQINGLAGSLCDYVYQTNRPLSINDLREGAPVEVAGLIANGLFSYLGVPLEAKGRILGTLCTFNQIPGLINERLLDFTHSVGIQIGFAIENANLFKETLEAEEALRKSEADLRALFASMEDVVLVVDRDGRYVRIAPTNPSRLIRPPEELLGRLMEEFIDRETSERFKVAIRQTLETGVTSQIEYELPVGEEKYWFLANLSKLNEENVFWVARDITERKHAEETLRNSEARLSEALQTAKLAYWEYDFVKDEFTFNDQFYALFHTTAEREGGYTMPSARYAQRFCHPDDVGMVGAEIQKAVETTDPNYSTQLDHRILYADGGVGYITVRFRIEKDAQGRTIKSHGANQDITERKQAEEAVQRQNEYLAASAEIGRLITSTLDLNTLFSRTVNLVCERFGFYHAAIFTVEETGFNAVLREATGEAGEAMKAQKHSLPVGSSSIVGEVTQIGKYVVVNDAENSPIHKKNPLLPETRAEAAIPLRIGSRIIGALDIQATQVGAFHEDDIAVLQALADQVAVAIDNARSYELSQQAVMEMREIDRLKSQFLANMSHELRTPLNSIIGFSRVILKGIDGPVTELQQQDLTAIYNSGQHLLGLINDILDLSKIEAGKMELAFDEVNMSDVTNSVLSTMTGLIKDKPITLRRVIQPDLPSVRADAIRIRQVMINLLSNAAKFTDEGEIVVSLEVKPGMADRPELVVSVTDTGPGIAPQDQGKLFQPFSQVDDSPTRKTGGTGLGLSICQHLIQMHGGRIGVNSTMGKGSTFYFTLPLYRREKDLEGLQTNGKVILAIDDDPQVISLYERYLQPQGYQVIALTDPSRAVERVRHLKPFAITLDIMMPGIDGWQVLGNLKSDPETHDVPVIICSIIEDQEKGFSLGAADYLVKPILEEDLVNSLDRLNADGSIREVLIIDDDPNDLRLIGKMLNDDGRYKPILAQGGVKGWEVISSKTPPHAVILDLFMPDMDGFRILENLRADENLRDIPVIVISGVDLTPEQHKQLTDFGQHLLAKGSINEKELFMTIQRSLQRVPGG
jgi:PAS domain S-box-containing protein